ncbi:MAG: polyprenyl synthetase family protein [Christensenellaceae bacterium]|jgi:geranylgeranyl diphosphate synthase type II|nr:polyprenyl synthetase family protein [Christensenellaceae bacterium]
MNNAFVDLTSFDNSLSLFLKKTKVNCDSILFSAIEYALNGGGKRVRPSLMLLTAAVLDVPQSIVIPYALAIECIHTYSLIHDDLPAMDNDDFRRGRPTVHKVFGEAIAILAGDALLNSAYEILLEQILENTNQNLIEASFSLAKAAGVFGMVGGQASELVFSSANEQFDKNAEKNLFEIYAKKTGALIIESISIPCILASIPPIHFQTFRSIGRSLGLVFQLTDDIIDTISGVDDGELTIVNYIGIDSAKNLVKEKQSEIIQSFSNLPYQTISLSKYINTLCDRTI